MTPTEPILRLAPHEVPISDFLDPIYPPFLFRTNWEGREREFAGQVLDSELGDLTFFWLPDEPECGNFVSAWTPPMRKSFLPKPLAFGPRYHSPMSDPAATLARECAHSWGRVYFLDENLRASGVEHAKRRLFLSQDGGGEWRQQRYFPQTGSPFVWASREDAHLWARLAPLELLEQFLATVKDDANSDAAHALQWDELPHEKRYQICRPLARGDYSEWQRILGLFTRSHHHIWNEDKFSWRVAHIPLVCDHKDWDFYFRFEPFCEWLQQYFEPSVDVDLTRKCTAAAQWAQQGAQVSAKVFRPTQHERLEALLQLRDWLRDKATPLEIESLLRAE